MDLHDAKPPISLSDIAKNPTTFGTPSARRLGAKSLKDSLEILVEEQKATIAEREALEKTRQLTDAKIADCDVRIQSYAAALEILRRKVVS